MYNLDYVVKLDYGYDIAISNKETNEMIFVLSGTSEPAEIGMAYTLLKRFVKEKYDFTLLPHCCMSHRTHGYIVYKYLPTYVNDDKDAVLSFLEGGRYIRKGACNYTDISDRLRKDKDVIKAFITGWSEKTIDDIRHICVDFKDNREILELLLPRNLMLWEFRPDEAALKGAVVLKYIDDEGLTKKWLGEHPEIEKYL